MSHYVRFDKSFKKQSDSNILKYGGGVATDHHKFFNDDCKEFDYIPHTLHPTDRTIAIGDVHGDLNVAIATLELAKCIKKVTKNIGSDNIDATDVPDTVVVNGLIYKWIGKNTQVVQVGDQVDRCRPTGDQDCKDPDTTPNDEASDVTIMKFYTDLNKVAMKYGGRVISLLGNHELMNVLGNMKYVSYKNIMEFADKGDNVEEALKKRKLEFSNKHKLNGMNRFMACTRVSAVIIGDILFVHGGIVEAIAKKYGIEDINLIVRKWLLGKVEDELVNDIMKHGKEIKGINVEKEVNYLIGSKDSIFWNRFFGYLPIDINGNEQQHKIKKNCDKMLDPVFDTYNIGSIVIGHTPQTKIGGINSTCGERVWRVDIGASKAFDKFKETNDNNNIAVLQITYNDDKPVVKVLT